MKKSMSTISGLIILLLTTGTTAVGWSLNPLKWCQEDKTKIYQEELENRLTAVEQEYASLITLLSSCDINPQAKDLLAEIQKFQNSLIEFIQEHHKAEHIIIQQKKGPNKLYLEYPCITYKKRLGSHITELEKAITQYKNRINEKRQDKMLLEKANVLLLNLAVVDELLLYSKQFSDECTDYANKNTSYNNQVTTDVSALVQKKPDTAVSASSS